MKTIKEIKNSIEEIDTRMRHYEQDVISFVPGLNPIRELQYAINFINRKIFISNVRRREEE